MTWQTAEATYAERGRPPRRARAATRPDGSPAPRRGAARRRRERPAADRAPRARLRRGRRCPSTSGSCPADRAPAERLIGAVADRTVDAVTFTSAHAVTNFAAIADRPRRVGRGRPGLQPTASWSRARRAGDRGAGPVARACSTRSSPAAPASARWCRRWSSRLSGRSAVLDLGRHAAPHPGPDGGGGQRRAGEPDRPGAGRARHARPATGCGRLEAGAAAARSGPARPTTTSSRSPSGRLRRRLGPAGGHIETVMRRGYRLSTT